MLTVAREGVVGKPDALAQRWPMCEAHWPVSDTSLVPPGHDRAEKDEALPASLTGLLTGSYGTALQSREGFRVITERSRR